MSSVEAILIGDPHLGSMTNLFPNYKFDPDDLIFKAMDMPIDYAYENDIENIIILGDIFDTPYPSQNLQTRLLKWLKEHRNRLKFYAIAGNHDYSNNDTISLHTAEFITAVSSEFSHVRFFTKPDLVKLDGVPFSFLPWPHCKTLQDPSINIAHVEISGSRTDNGKLIKEGYKLNVGDGYAYIGHLHQKQFFSKRNVYYPGNLFQKNFGETLPKGFLHITAQYKNGELNCSHEFHPIKPPFELINLKIEHYDDFKKIKKPDPKNIRQYRLMIKNGVELPVGLREDYPNIVTIEGKLSKKELLSIEKGEYKADLVDTSFDLLDGLDDFLINEGLNSKQLKFASKRVAHYINT